MVTWISSSPTTTPETVSFFTRNAYADGNHYLQVRLNGAGLNTQGIGAWIEVTADGETQVREIRASNNFVSQSPAEAHFGLGDADQVDVYVRWPDGTETTMNDVAADQLLTISQP